MGLILVLGGTRSGKSEVAERLAGRERQVTFIATGVADPDDHELAERIAQHRRARSERWATVEVGPDDDLPALIAATAGPILLDSLGTWLAAQAGMEADGDELTAALADRPDATVVVSDEVGLGVHPSTAAGRQFRDRLGRLNRTVAARAERVLLVVAGRPLELDEP